jgi:DNA polymerase III subunit epsilon
MTDLAEVALAEAPIVVLDTETTGLNPRLGHRVVELGAIRLELGPAGSWQVAAEFSRLVNPGRPMDPGATRVNGIRDADLIGAPTFADIAPDFLALLDGALLVAHNAQFDADFLASELAIWAESSSVPVQNLLTNPWLCTLRLARLHFHFGYNGLPEVARQLGVRVGRFHRALNDAFVTAEVLRRMLRHLAHLRIETVGDLLHLQGGPIYAAIPALPALPGVLAQALNRRLPIRLVYHGQSGPTTRIVEPLQAAEYQGNRYLIAYCRLRQAQRTFRLDRVISIELLEP